MKNYTTKDFSPIFGPFENPKKKGWYITSSEDYLITWAYVNASQLLPKYWFRQWDGNKWIGLPKQRHDGRYWFGLKENPKK